MQAWRRESSRNEAKYQDLVRVLALAGRVREAVDAGPAPTLAQLRARSEEVPLEIQKRIRARPERRPVWRRRWVAAAAAIVVLGVAISEVRPGPGAEQFIADQSGSTTVNLRDGSVVRLAPGSRMRLLERAGGRGVFLKGRAFFAVARDTERPFRIQTSAGEVTVLGTRFDLAAENEDLHLVVLEGRVEVAAGGGRTEVTAGQTVEVLNGALLPVTQVADPQACVPSHTTRASCTGDRPVVRRPH